MVLAPEHELVNQITTGAQREEVEKYLDYVKSRSERERLAEVKSLPVHLRALMQLILLMEGKFLSGYQNMFWPDMEREQLWRCRAAISVILILPGILIFPLPILSVNILMAKKPILLKKPSL